MAEHDRGVALFVHGFGSSHRCWDRLLALLREDSAVTDRWELATWDYPTRWVELNILGRIPRLKELGRALGDAVDSPRYRGRPLTLVGHSQGGLVILSWMADLLERAQGERLGQVRQAICVASPLEGSTTAISLRALASTLLHNPQETTLRVLNPDVADLRAVARERIAGATEDTPHSWRVPVHVLYGLQDGIVPEASARGPFESVRGVPGNHFTILKPPDRQDARYAELAELLVDPGGHAHRFEVEAYESVIRVEPCVRQAIVRATPRNPGPVEFDNVAAITRAIRFAPSNRCRQRFSIPYATRQNGYVVGHPSHRNEAPPAAIGRGEDTGTYFQFDFTPVPHEEFRVRLDVYDGFGEGNRDLHFHLGTHSYFRRLVYVIDLSAYLAAGCRISTGPHLYFNPDDVPHGELCARRTARAPLTVQSTPSPGVFRWELTDVRQGVVDIAWDVTGVPHVAGVPGTLRVAGAPGTPRGVVAGTG